MVRFKNRWLLLSIALLHDDDDVDGDASHPSGSTSSYTSLNSNLSPANLIRSLRASISDNFGELGSGALGGSSLTCKYCSPATRTAIVRCARSGCDLVRGAASLVDRIGRARARVSVVHCGGTIRKVQEEAIRLDRRKILALEKERRRREAALLASRVERGVGTDAARGFGTGTELGAGLEVEMDLGIDDGTGGTKAGAHLDEETKRALKESKTQILAVKQ